MKKSTKTKWNTGSWISESEQYKLKSSKLPVKIIEFENGVEITKHFKNNADAKKYLKNKK